MKEIPTVKLINLTLKNNNAYTFVELAKKTGFNNVNIHRVFNGTHKMLTPAFKLILDNIPPDQLHPFLCELYHYYYNENECNIQTL